MPKSEPGSRERAARAFCADTSMEGHGRYYGYKYYGCRCERCTDANRQQKRHQAAKKAGKPVRVTTIEEHLDKILPVKSDEHDPAWWHFTGQEWIPRWGSEMLGSDF